MICNPVAPAFVLADFYPPFSFVKFIGFTLAVSTAFKKGSMKLMEGIRFHLCASPLFHACAEGLTVADEFHVQQSFHLAAAIAPRRREKSARRQFSPLGTPSSAKRGEAHRIKEKRPAQEEPAPIIWNCGGTAARNHFMPA